MKPELKRFGNGASPVVVVDEFGNDSDSIIAIANSLAPFPPIAQNYYPGLRRIITRADKAANAYAEDLCERAGPLIAGAFDFTSFQLLEASFSIVTTPPGKLSARQRAPHFDTTDENILAILHYLRVPPSSGTGFFRQRSTAIEQVTKANLDAFISTAKADGEKLAASSGYIRGSDEFFEQIGVAEGVADRLIIYQSNLLHSGIIPQGMNFSGDPREGRLTANLFVRGSRSK